MLLLARARSSGRSAAPRHRRAGGFVLPMATHTRRRATYDQIVEQFAFMNLCWF